ncbi:MAG: ABC transporter ATP-binding protein [Gemmatimonadaceae bacterium]|nr:ABC transporter ATP-binding protein [Acetobacteraceae bacterium]
MLSVDGLDVSYGPVQALHGVSFHVAPGEIVVLLGANGAGKTTTLSAVSGLVRARAGQVRFDGAEIAGLSVETIARRGLAHCPEGRRVFPGLTVLENLVTGAAPRGLWAKLDEDLDAVFTLFPRLAERRKQRGWSLSGGEQQMLAIGRALMSRPRLLMLDEPSLGLAPRLQDQVLDAVAEVSRARGLTVLLVEQNAAAALDIAARAYVLETGRVVLEGPSVTLKDDPRIQSAYLGG